MVSTSDMVSSDWLWALIGSLPAIFWLILHSEPEVDAREPPLVRQRIPFIGNLIGMYLDGPGYYKKTSLRTDEHIHTIGVLGKKLYIVNEPTFIAPISREARNISFTPFISELGIRLTGADRTTRDIIERDLTGPNKRNGYVSQIHDQTISTLSRGADLDKITSDMVGKCAMALKARSDARSSDSICFYAFLRQLVTVSSTTALYGPANPFAKDATLEESFWTYVAGMNMLLLNIYPSIIARKGYQARHRVAKAFATYFADSNAVDGASSYAKMRYRIAVQNGIDWLNMGRLEAGGLIGVLVNTIPTTFFMLLHAFQSPALVADIRRELDEVCVSKDADGKQTLNLSKVSSDAELLNAICTETLRLHSENASARFIMEDTQLHEGPLLKKGSILLMPNSVLHQDDKTWGRVDFQPRRFYGRMKDSPQKRRVMSAFRPFGGGSTLCPGRHFADNEVLGLAAMIIWRFDVEAEKGELKIPQVQQQSLVEAIIPPKHDLRVKMRPRADVDGDWDFTLGKQESDGEFK